MTHAPTTVTNSLAVSSGAFVCLPSLSAPQVLQSLADGILAEVAPDDRLDADVSGLIRQTGAPPTSCSLRPLPFQVSRQGRTREIDEVRVPELLPWLAGDAPVSDACRRHPTTARSATISTSCAPSTRGPISRRAGLSLSPHGVNSVLHGKLAFCLTGNRVEMVWQHPVDSS